MAIQALELIVIFVLQCVGRCFSMGGGGGGGGVGGGGGGGWGGGGGGVGGAPEACFCG